MAADDASAAHPALARTLLVDRIAAIPRALDEVLAAPLPEELFRIAQAPRFIVTGGGFSEGPARVLVALLQRTGRSARYLPLSSFASAIPPSDAALILFSQGLAPNAQLPLAHVESFAETLIFTSVGTNPTAGSGTVQALREKLARRGVIFWNHPPVKEDTLLVRVVGPAAALACVLRLLAFFEAAAQTSDQTEQARLFATLPARYSEALAPPEDLFRGARSPLAIVAGEEICELAFPLRWKLLEGLRVPDPSVWDFLQVIHGPLQAFYESPMTLLTFEQEARPIDRDFVARLESLLDPARHRIVRFKIPQPTAELNELPVALRLLWQLLLLDAELNGALAKTASAHALHLGDWPLRKRDGALYDIDPATLQLSLGDGL